MAPLVQSAYMQDQPGVLVEVGANKDVLYWDNPTSPLIGGLSPLCLDTAKYLKPDTHVEAPLVTQTVSVQYVPQTVAEP